MPRRRLIRTLGLAYMVDGYETSADPDDIHFSEEERQRMKLAIIEQHPDTGIADFYRDNLGINNAPVAIVQEQRNPTFDNAPQPQRGGAQQNNTFFRQHRANAAGNEGEETESNLPSPKPKE